MGLLIYIPVFFYKERNIFPNHPVTWGGKIPVNKSHLVIDKPESVSLVSPPTIIINATKKVINNNQSEINLLF